MSGRRPTLSHTGPGTHWGALTHWQTRLLQIKTNRCQPLSAAAPLLPQLSALGARHGGTAPATAAMLSRRTPVSAACLPSRRSGDSTRRTADFSSVSEPRRLGSVYYSSRRDAEFVPKRN